MANVFIALDSDGIQELLKSAEMAEACEEQAARMTRATGVEYKSDVYIGKTRVAAGGRKKLTKKDYKNTVCPKCGEWHPNCTCNKE